MTIVHTSMLAVESLTALFEELGPDVELRHVVDDVLAQGSMAAIVPRLGETRVPVLMSPRLGVERAVDVAREVAARRGAG